MGSTVKSKVVYEFSEMGQNWTILTPNRHLKGPQKAPGFLEQFSLLPKNTRQLRTPAPPGCTNPFSPELQRRQNFPHPCLPPNGMELGDLLGRGGVAGVAGFGHEAVVLWASLAYAGFAARRSVGDAVGADISEEGVVELP